MKLLSYNIHKGIGGRDRRYDLGRVIKVIADEQPDIVLLQEVDRHVGRSSGHDQPRLLAEALGMEHHRYQLNVPLKHGGYGNLLLSLRPFATYHAISLRLNSRKPRGAQIAVVDGPGGPLQVVNWHLGLTEAERLWQARRLAGHHFFIEGLKHPTIVAGDANDWRNVLARDVFAPAGFDHATAPIGRFRTFPAYFALGSLDKAWTRGLKVKARVVRNALARKASDHLPLVLEW